MNIGNTYAENKVYRGIRHSNKLPLTAEDLHEFADTLYAKSGHLLENLVGSGIISKSALTLTSDGIQIVSPISVNIAGDIVIIGNSADKQFVRRTDLLDTTKGTVFVVGWYQHLDFSSVLKEYGGVQNDTLVNDFIYTPLNIQVSTRYQFRWDVVVIKGDVPTPLTFNLPLRDKDGELTGESAEITTNTLGSIYIADAPPEMDYAVDGLYIVPLIEYRYNTSTNNITSANTVPPRSSYNIIKQNTEPTGVFGEGTIWYNTDTEEFRTYIVGKGFVSNTAVFGIAQYQYVDKSTETNETPTDMTYFLDTVPSLANSDIVRVVYEGLELTADIDYTLDRSVRELTLKNFIRRSGETLTVYVTKITEITDATNITQTLSDHMRFIGGNNTAGHVKLSDDTDSDSGRLNGVAATPYAVKMSRIMKDELTDISYKLGIRNGVVYIEEV